MQVKFDYCDLYFLPFSQAHLDVLWCKAKSDVDQESKVVLQGGSSQRGGKDWALGGRG